MFGHRQIRRKQTVVPLGAPGPLKVDEEAEAVRDCVSDTPVVDDQSDHDMEIPSASTKHAASSSLPGERVKVQKMDDDPVPMPETKASRTDDKVNQVEEIEMCHNDESMFPEGFEDDAVALDSEDEYIAGQGGVLVHPVLALRSCRGWKRKQRWMKLRSCIRWM